MNAPLHKLRSPYEPGGDQPEAIETICRAVNSGKKHMTILGATGTGKTFTMANIIARTGKTALVMAPNKTLAAQLYAEFRDFFPESAVEYFVSYYDYYQPEAYVPSRDLFIEKDSSINEHIEQMRLSATKALLERKDAIIVATVSAIYGLGSPESYHDMILSLRTGGSLAREAAIAQLCKMQYNRAEMEFARGTFRVRGETIDIFPSEHSKDAIRVSLGEDKIEKITRIDALTGQNLGEVPRFNVFPASHYVANDESMQKAKAAIEKELEERLREFADAGKHVERQRLEARTKFDLEMIAEIGFCKGIENYSRHIAGKVAGEAPATLFDYLPKDALLIIDESHITVPQIGSMFRGDRARKENLVGYGFRLPSALDNRPLKFEEFEAKMPQTIYVSATPGDYESERSQATAQLVIRPTGVLDPEISVRSALTQIDDLLGEAKKRIALGQRILVTSLTKKMAENITEFLRENGIRSRYLHSDIDNIERVEILRDLRKGEFDLLVGINLLREGLDLPEVGLVAILDADKEGFLRSARSLIQTIGRAARNPEGCVILYGDKITPSMKAAMDETERRRNIQAAHNLKTGKKPQKAQSQIKELIDGVFCQGGEKKEAGGGGKALEGLSDEELLENLELYDTPSKINKAIAKAQKDMKKAASELEFEKAAALRDKISMLRDLLVQL